MTTDGKPKTSSRASTRREVIAGVWIGVGSLALRGTNSLASTTEEISHSAESIHHEVTLRAARQRVYTALTDPKQFQMVTLLGEAVKSGMVQAMKPAEISPQVGGLFALFGGHITGQIIELVPNERIVQAWRPADWAPGIYSIAKFELVENGPGTKIKFDHTGFPKGQAEHLAAGWKGNYWEPLQKLLSGT
jgi:uncharacterized protein YndB with AHSA1/START domain